MKMVVSDIDGTLLRSDKSISRRTLHILNKLSAQNIMFVIATARAKRSVSKMLPFNFSNMYAIYYNGAEIYYGNKLLYSKYIEAHTVQSVISELLDRFPKINISLEIYNKLFANFDIGVMNGLVPPYTQVDFRAFEYKPTAKILVDLRGITDVQKIKDILPEYCNMIITDGGIVGQISHKDVSKVNAIKVLTRTFGYGLEEVVAFGDDHNDIDMISECGIGVAMGNAPQKVKDMADIVTMTNDQDGVAIELEQILYKLSNTAI